MILKSLIGFLIITPLNASPAALERGAISATAQPDVCVINMSLNLASMTAIKEEILNREDVAIYIIQKMLEFYPEQFKARYKLDDSFDEIVPILDHIAKNIGAIKNEDIDYEKVYITILKDLRNGYIGGVTFDRYED